MGCDCRGSPPYGHLVITPSPAFFLAAWKNGHTLFLDPTKKKKNLVNTVAPFNTANFFGQLVTVLTGFHCI